MIVLPVVLLLLDGAFNRDAAPDDTPGGGGAFVDVLLELMRGG